MNPHRLLLHSLSILLILTLLGSTTHLPTRAENQAALADLNPTLLGQAGGASLGVTYMNGYAYVGIGPRLYVFDATNLSAPKLVGVSERLPGVIQDVKAITGVAFVTLGEGGFAVISVSTPQSPTVLGIYDTPGFARGLFIDGIYAYVADGTNGVVVLNFSVPSAIAHVATYDTPGSARDVLISNAGWDIVWKIFVADGSGGLLALRASDGELLSSHPTIGYAEAVAVSNPYIYIAGGDSGLELYFITSNDWIKEMLGSNDTPGYAQDVAVYGTYLYIADGSGGLRIMNKSVDLTDKGSFASPGLASGLYLMPDGAGSCYVFLADYTGLRIVNNSITFPTAMSGYNSPALPARLAASGNYAYIADRIQGLRIFNTTDPALPVLAGSVLVGWAVTPGSTYDVAVSEGKAYLADGKAGLHIVDVIDPAKPGNLYTQTVNTAGDAVAVAVAGDTVYLADSDQGLVGVAITQTLSGTVTLTSTFSITGTALDVAVAGDYAYVAYGDAGLVIVNRFPFSEMTLAGQINTPGSARAVAVQGDYAYVADGFAGLRIINISNPSLPVQAGYYDTVGLAVDVAVAGKMVYLVEKDVGVRALDVSNPANPVQLFVMETLGAASGVSLTSEYVYIADEQGGLVIYDMLPIYYSIMLPLMVR